VACVRSILAWAPMTLGNGQHWWVYESPRTGMLDASGSGLARPLESTHQAAVGRTETLTNVSIWTPPHFASTPSSGDEVRLLTYIRPLSDLDQPRSGHDGLCARRLLIALPGFSPVDIPRLFRRRFDLFAILRSARNRGDTLLDQSGRAASGRHVFRFVVRAMPQHRPRDSGQLVCERRRRNVRM